jgi:hypothetical protein
MKTLHNLPWKAKGEAIIDKTGELIGYISDHRNKHMYTKKERDELAEFIVNTVNTFCSY